MEGFEAIIEHLERQSAAIAQALEALRASGTTTPESHAPGSQETGNARSIGQKVRWAAARGETAPKKGQGLTQAGRERLSENMRKRWAAKRTGTQAKNRARR